MRTVRVRERCEACGETVGTQVGIEDNAGQINWGALELAPGMVEQGRRTFGYATHRVRPRSKGSPLVVKGPDPASIRCQCGTVQIVVAKGGTAV